MEEKLAELGAEVDGSIAVDNARLSYVRFEGTVRRSTMGTPRELGARPQRLLWASTGTKSDALPDTFYVDELIGGPTVNTVPPATLDAFLDHGTVAPTSHGARERFDARLGIDLGRSPTSSRTRA